MSAGDNCWECQTDYGTACTHVDENGAFQPEYALDPPPNRPCGCTPGDDERTVRMSRSCLRENLMALRYSGSVQAHLPDPDIGDEADFLDQASLWLIEFAQRLAVAAATTTEMAAELDQLRKERAAIRSFFGTTRAPGEQ